MRGGKASREGGGSSKRGAAPLEIFRGGAPVARKGKAQERKGERRKGEHSLVAQGRGGTSSWSREEDAQPLGQEKRKHSLVIKRRGGTVSWSREEDAQPGGGTA